MFAVFELNKKNRNIEGVRIYYSLTFNYLVEIEMSWSWSFASLSEKLIL